MSSVIIKAPNQLKQYAKFNQMYRLSKRGQTKLMSPKFELKS